ncbi:MAG TPA: hypothetical protein VFL90_04735, partial [Methylomirabilota bacterium]|nr:hypothetical protein [Methylomirabilota bacterium]
MFVAPGAPAVLGDGLGAARVDAPAVAAACVLAAVTGELTEAPAAALVSLADAVALSPGLALAARDRCPLIVLTEAHADAALLAPLVKARLALLPAPATTLARARALALADPRGPVHVACDGALSIPPATAEAAGPSAPTPEALEGFAAVLARAARPVLVTGLECGAGDAAWVRALAESLPAPVLATTKGRGVLPEPH